MSSTSMDVSEQGPSQTSKALVRFYRNQKCVGDVSLYMQLEFNAPGYLSIPTDKSLKE
jgi:hypothetical protein